MLDIACGKGGPAIVLASTFGCRIVGVELRPRSPTRPAARVAARGLETLVAVETADARELPARARGVGRGALSRRSFVWGNIGDAAAALAPAVRPGGFVAIGEPYWHECRRRGDDDFVDLVATVERFPSSGLALTGLIAASEDDWDRYESLHWRALEEWLADHPEADGSGRCTSALAASTSLGASCSAGRSSSA